MTDKQPLEEPPEVEEGDDSIVQHDDVEIITVVDLLDADDLDEDDVEDDGDDA